MSSPPPPTKVSKNHRKVSSSLISGAFDPDEMLRKHFASIELESTVHPIPYSSDVEYTDSPEPSQHGNEEILKHKKVTIVGTSLI